MGAVDIIIKLVVCHAIGDLALQTQYMALHKGQNTFTGFMALTAHCLTYAGVFYFVFKNPIIFFILFFSHFATDLITSRFKGLLLEDQLVHLIVLFICFGCLYFGRGV